MIIVTEGNLLEDRAEALVNTVNTVGVSGRGIALQFKLRFPLNDAAYRSAAQRGDVVLGKVLPVEIAQLNGPKWIINLPTKAHWRSRSRLEDIEADLDDLVRFVRSTGIASVAVPPLGCGNGGLAWADVEPLIIAKLTRVDGLAVHLFPPDAAPAPTQMRVGTPRPRMTVTKAVLISALSCYLRVAEGASRLVAQKLAYLSQTAGAPLRLSFVKARYGPYAETLNFVLQEMEGHFTVGYGDRSGPSPLQLVSGADEEAATIVRRNTELERAVRRVGELIDGFESPYGLELLSTVHLVAATEPNLAVDASGAAERVRAWSPRKGALFTDHHIAVAWERLSELGWLPTPGPLTDAENEGSRLRL